MDEGAIAHPFCAIAHPFIFQKMRIRAFFKKYLKRDGTGRSVGTERVRVGGRSVFRRTIFQKNRIREFFEKCFKRDGTERVGTERVGRVGNPLGRQSLL